MEKPVRVHELDEKDGFAVCRIIDLSALLKDVPSVEKWCAFLASMPNGEKHLHSKLGPSPGATATKMPKS
jgi:hypothetical protein